MSDTTSTFRLPTLQQTLLDEATVTSLFRDLAACTQIMAVLPKWAVQPVHTHTTLQPIPIAAAQAGLSDGTLRGAQIRYRYENRLWCDTLIARSDGIRLVRICEDDIVATLLPS